MTKELKIKLFEKMYALEELAGEDTFDGFDYNEQANGAYKMLDVLGLGHEYIQWSFNKDYSEVIHMKW